LRGEATFGNADAALDELYEFAGPIHGLYFCAFSC